MRFRSNPRLLRCGRLQGLFSAALVGSRGIVAGSVAVSTRAKADELPLACLDEGAVERARVDLVGADRLAAELHATLVDLPAPVAAGVAEDLLEQARQVDGAVRRLEPRLRHLVRSLVPADDAGEMCLGRPCALGAVPALGDSPRKLELPLHRVVRMLAAAGDELPPLRERLVGDRHRLAEHLLGRLEN